MSHVKKLVLCQAMIQVYSLLDLADCLRLTSSARSDMVSLSLISRQLQDLNLESVAVFSRETTLVHVSC